MSDVTSQRSDTRSQFLIAVGELCLAASAASLRVEVGLRSGERILGVPGSLREAQGEDEVDETGFADTFTVGDAIVRLRDVVACTVLSPAEA